MKKTFIAFCLLFSCSNKNTNDLCCIQVIDRNGLNETISSQDSLAKYKKTNFENPQPYRQIVRVFEDKSSIITSYHSNGQLYQYLEVKNARAFGKYKKWHSSGNLAIEATIVGGQASLSVLDQTSWIFDKQCTAWDEEGNLLSIFNYDKGLLQGKSFFYNKGSLIKEIPYNKGKIEGTLIEYQDSEIISKSTYLNDKKNGKAEGFFFKKTPCYCEIFKDDLLLEGKYFDKKGKVLSNIFNGNGTKIYFNNEEVEQIVEYKRGIPEGKVKILKDNKLYKIYHVKDNQKNGEEIEYYLDEVYQTPKIIITWKNDKISGFVKTYFKNNNLESQKEFYQNKKHGINTAWYRNGSLMLVEEYENDVLKKGSYYKNNEKTPVSTICEGKGIATLFTFDGIFLKTISYNNGLPEIE